MRYIRINEKDNVAIALTPLSAGEVVDIGQPSQFKVVLREDIPQGHKLALREIAAGENIIKYGNPIGGATEHIPAGSWVHTHNVRTNLGETLKYEYAESNMDAQKELLSGSHDLYFNGYVRENGKVAIRNEVWIIPTVGCINNIAQTLAQKVAAYGEGRVDAVVAFPHPYGCSQMGEDQENTRKALGRMASHPHGGAVLMLGLGCENCQLSTIKPYVEDSDSPRIAWLECQQVEDELEEGERLLRRLIDQAAAYERRPIPLSQLVIGLKCGGSDGLSGITVNPLVGRLTDQVVSSGGSAILTEVPEMFGAEQLLMDRCKDRQVFDRLVGLIDEFKNYYRRHGQVIYENPSPGNKQGGITTLEDKSLGCVQKSGSCPVSDVLRYGEPVKVRGLSLLSSPGNDLVATTALALSGAHMVLFTTGRGTPFGGPVPTMKLASNRTMAQRKKGWIDFSAGDLVEGVSMDFLAEELLGEILAVASGKKTKSEQLGFRDWTVFKQGVTL